MVEEVEVCKLSVLGLLLATSAFATTSFAFGLTLRMSLTFTSLLSMGADVSADASSKNLSQISPLVCALVFPLVS